MRFQSIKVHAWRQFRDVQIQLHPKLTVLTGPNGSGKSTLLSLFSRCMENSSIEPFLATPIRDRKTGVSRYSLRTVNRSAKKHIDENEAIVNSEVIGEITLNSGTVANLRVDDNNRLQYEVFVEGPTNVPGFMIGSHRAQPRYQEVKVLPVSGISPNEALQYFFQSQRHYFRGDMYRRDGRSITNPVAPLKETLIGFAAFGEDNKNMKAVPELVGLFDKFQDILRKVLPTEIGFQRLEVRSPEIIIVSKTGDFPLDSASGGLMSIIQTTWQIFLFENANTADSVVLMDEPENHLHPSLQRDFLSNIVATFSNIQFIVATHSPFIVSSVKESSIYALRYVDADENGYFSGGAVSAQLISREGLAGTASKVLDEILGVPITIPVWAETELTAITQKFQSSDLTQASIDTLRNELKKAGLSEFFPEAIGRLAQ
ncbi:AAA family ATPase [Brucella anthropi]|uniref:AAA family ATPase n=1 Tax=Brucella anthropi TaxID=529 RepID=UPI00312C89D5